MLNGDVMTDLGRWNMARRSPSQDVIFQNSSIFPLRSLYGTISASRMTDLDTREARECSLKIGRRARRCGFTCSPLRDRDKLAKIALTKE